MRALLLAVPALAVALAACEPQTNVDSGPPDAPEVPQAPEIPDAPEASTITLGGVDLAGAVSLVGTEPFWGVRTDGAEWVYDGADRPEQRAPRGEPTISGTTAVWTTTTTAGNALVITLTEDPDCSDGMSDRIYPLGAQVVIAGETLNGCAGSTEWMQSAGEGG